MGVRNRERRAAKKRVRRATGGPRPTPRADSSDGSLGPARASGASGEPGPFGPFGAAQQPGPDPDAVLRGRLLDAADTAVTGGRDDGVLAARVGVLLGPETSHSARTVGRLAATMAESILLGCWRHGWQPADLVAVARRRLPAGYAPVVGAMVRELSRRSPAARVDPRWAAQLAAIPDDDPELADQVGRLSAWAQTSAGLAAALAVAGLGRSLPQLPSDIPLPGLATAQPDRAEGVDSRALDRIRALLAKAESTTFPEEAEALSGKAQELMSRLSIDRLVVEAADGPGPVVRLRRIWLDAPYVLAKAQLADAVAQANHCRVVVSERLGFATVFGDARELDTVEMMTTSLLVQANRAMLAHGRQVDRSGRSRSRSFRQSFLVSYALRIGERLTQAADGVVAAADRSGADLLPVLRSVEQRVTDEVGRVYPALTRAGASVNDGAGWAAGRVAADQAAFDVHGPIAR